ncbi:MAG: phenylacetate--CoA ligase family protein [Candidatus Bathyarchaeota archaeon]|nr:phenylacetate--CoA ligase family protein [Candidatus Bathyarchaeota archaeon]
MSIFKVLWHLRELRKNQWLKTSEIVKIQEKKLRAIVKYAYENVEFYHRKFDALGLKPHDIETVQDLQKLPIISRLDVQRNFPNGLVSTNVSVENCKRYTSSGSTGIPVTVICNSKCEDFRGALFMRPFFECGLKLRDKMVRIADVKNRSSWYEYFGWMRKICISPMAPVKNTIPLLEQYKPDVIYGHSSYIFLLAKEIREMGVKNISPRIVIGTAELLSKKMRDSIESSFGVKMFDFYGSVEVERLAWECEEWNGYHMDIDAQVIEFVRNEEIAAPGERGKIIVTCLYNYAMPLIRYDLGDVGVASDEKCACGRGLPLMKRIEGRTNDFLKCPDGRLVSPMAIFAVMDYFAEIAQFRAIQEKKNKVVVEIVKGRGFSDKTIHQVVEKVGSIMGEEVLVEPVVVDHIPRDPTGKMRVVRSRIWGSEQLEL